MNNPNASSLFHYTREYDVLCSILRDGFIPNYCCEDFTSFVPGLEIGIPMVSFCDIPITRAYCHMKKYGEYAIGLSNRVRKNLNINPVLYLTGESRLSCIFEYLFDKSDEIHGNMFMKNEDEIDSSQDLFTLINREYYLSKEASEVAFCKNILLGYVKPYYAENGYINYDEREWRYVLPEKYVWPSLFPDYTNSEKTVKWLWTKQAYKEWKYGEKYVECKDTPKPNPDFDKLYFASEDVSYIIVKSKEELVKIVDFITQSNTIGGVSISDFQKKVLLTKIISMRQLNADL